jgi:hypothetical protein
MNPPHDPAGMIILDIIPVVRIPFHSDWTFWALVIVLAILAGIQAYYHKLFILMSGSVFSRRNLSQLVRETNVLRHRITPGLVIIYLSLISLLIFQGMRLYDIRFPFSFSDFRYFILIFALVSLFWAVKIFLMDFLAVIFKTEAINYDYQLNILLNTSMLGLILLPLMVMLIYLPVIQLFWLGFLITLFLSVLRFIKGFLIGLSLTRFSYFFLFVYLCTLEILPLLVVLKLIMICLL